MLKNTILDLIVIVLLIVAVVCFTVACVTIDNQQASESLPVGQVGEYVTIVDIQDNLLIIETPEGTQTSIITLFPEDFEIGETYVLTINDCEMEKVSSLEGGDR